MKPTLLAIVQEVLNDGDGDFINSIDDTEEAQQVAVMVESTYRAMLSNRNWPHTNRVLELVPSSNSNLPTHMQLPENLKELISVYYDKRRVNDTALNYREVKWKEPDDFLRYTFGRNSDNDNILTVTDPSGVVLLIANDKAPDYFTTFDDTTLVFDSYDIEVDDSLQATKSLARGYIMPTFTISDTYVPDLPEEAFTALIEEVKSRYSLKLRLVEDVKAEQEATRQQRWLSRKAWRTKGGVRYPNYGRKPHRWIDPTFRKDDN